MPLPSLLNLATQDQHRTHYESTLVQRRIVTADGWRVRFYPETFEHAFFTSSSRTRPVKDVFDLSRARRMDWIPAVLHDPSVECYRRIVRGKLRRLFLEPSVPYLVVTEVRGPESDMTAVFVTAYVVASTLALTKIRSNSPW